MAKRSEDISASAADSAPSIAADESGTRLVSILFSKERDLYRVPTIDKPCWLSVKVYDLPATQLPADAIYLGPVTTANRMGWRKAYSTSWKSIVAGDRVTLPASDPMVTDYEAYAS
jgi:hypothetical protein